MSRAALPLLCQLGARIASWEIGSVSFQWCYHLKFDSRVCTASCSQACRPSRLAHCVIMQDMQAFSRPCAALPANLNNLNLRLPRRLARQPLSLRAKASSRATRAVASPDAPVAAAQPAAAPVVVEAQPASTTAPSSSSPKAADMQVDSVMAKELSENGKTPSVLSRSARPPTVNTIKGACRAALGAWHTAAPGPGAGAL